MGDAILKIGCAAVLCAAGVWAGSLVAQPPPPNQHICVSEPCSAIIVVGTSACPQMSGCSFAGDETVVARCKPMENQDCQPVNPQVIQKCKGKCVSDGMTDCELPLPKCQLP